MKMVRVLLPSKKLLLGVLISCSIILLYYYWIKTEDYVYVSLPEKSARSCHRPTYHIRHKFKITPSSHSKYLAAVQCIETVEEVSSSKTNQLQLASLSGKNSSHVRSDRFRGNFTLSQSILQGYAEPAALDIEHMDQRKRITIAIALGITSAKMDPHMNVEDMLQKFPTFSQLLPSFCHTVSCGYHYKFYFAYDVDDAFFTQDNQRNKFINQFKRKVHRRCPNGLNVEVHTIQCYHSRHPAWAQNDAAYAAYIEGADYIYRVNDDSWMDSQGWAEIFIHTLQRMNPPNVGVVGPAHTGGATDILTYDFTHRSHIEIFGFQYPRTFTDWTGDSWITFVYKPGRLAKLSAVRLRHSQVLGRRYDYHSKAKELPKILTRDREILHRYVSAKEHLQLHPEIRPDPSQVIAMSLYGDNYNYTNGAIRNAQLRDVFYPNWKLRFYVPHPSFSSTKHVVPVAYIQQLLKLGAEIMYVNTNNLGINLKHMNLLVGLDPDVKYFLTLNPNQRFSEQESELVQNWMNSKKMFMMVKEMHQAGYVTSGLYGAVRTSFVNTLGVNVVNLLRAVKQNNESLKRNSLRLTGDIEEIFLDKAKQEVLYFDSSQCGTNSSDHVYFKPQTWSIGEKFSGFGEDTDLVVHQGLPVC